MTSSEYFVPVLFTSDYSYSSCTTGIFSMTIAKGEDLFRHRSTNSQLLDVMAFPFFSIIFSLLGTAVYTAAWQPTARTGKGRIASQVWKRDSILLFASPASTTKSLDDALLQLLSRARVLGPVGCFCTVEEQKEVLDLARMLGAITESSDLKTNRILQPARNLELRGTMHDLVYSAATGTSSGRLFGPVYGIVQQIFADDDSSTFRNSVKLGPLKLTLQAKAEAMDDDKTKVTFETITATLFGNQLFHKSINGGGVWNYLFAGTLQNDDGSQSLIRVMEAPSLFVLEHKIAK